MELSISIPEQEMALALAPVGTIPVAVFPPYAIPRTVPAVTVIFKETQTGSEGPGSGIFNRFKTKLQQVKCIILRLMRQFGLKRRKAFCDLERMATNPYERGEFPNFDECTDDCSGPQDELYGFRTNVTLVDNVPCIPSATCEKVTRRASNPNDWRWSSATKRQTGEEFFSEAPPDCRVNNICQ